MSDIDDLFDEHEVSGGDNPPFAEFDSPGDSLVGVVEASREAFDDNHRVADVEQKNGQVVTTPTHAILRQKLENADVSAGDAVRIIYLGDVEANNGHMAKDYEVSVIPAAEVPDGFLGSEDDK
jgi:hypothetical protein